MGREAGWGGLLGGVVPRGCTWHPCARHPLRRVLRPLPTGRLCPRCSGLMVGAELAGTSPRVWVVGGEYNELAMWLHQVRMVPSQRTGVLRREMET